MQPGREDEPPTRLPRMGLCVYGLRERRSKVKLPVRGTSTTCAAEPRQHGLDFFPLLGNLSPVRTAKEKGPWRIPSPTVRILLPLPQRTVPTFLTFSVVFLCGIRSEGDLPSTSVVLAAAMAVGRCQCI